MELQPRLDGMAEFELEVGKMLHRSPSELANTLDARDWAYYRLSWEQHGTLVPLSVAEKKED